MRADGDRVNGRGRDAVPAVAIGSNARFAAHLPEAPRPNAKPGVVGIPGDQNSVVLRPINEVLSVPIPR